MTQPLKLSTRQLRRLERNLGTPKPVHKDRTSDVMTVLQLAAGRALDLAGVDRVTRQRVLLSGEFNRHCLKASREIVAK